MSFSSWMTKLRTQEQYATDASSLVSGVASSWAETDCDSDSETEFNNDVSVGPKKTCKLTAQRTAPIAIPQATHMTFARSSLEFMDSPAQQYPPLEDCDSRGSMATMDINEADLMLFGNLAYFRTQHGAQSGLTHCHRAPASCAVQSTVSSVEDEQIFDLEL